MNGYQISITILGGSVIALLAVLWWQAARTAGSRLWAAFGLILVLALAACVVALTVLAGEVAP